MLAWGGERMEQLASLLCSSTPALGPGDAAVWEPHDPPVSARPSSQAFVGTKVVQCPWCLVTGIRVHWSFLLMGYNDVLLRGQHEESLGFKSQRC